jgi:hypothetical protein
MKTKMAIMVSLLLVSVQTSSAQYYYNFYYQYMDTPSAENALAYAKARRERAREERELTGKSDQWARLRLQEECTRALERGVENNTRLSYGCSD